QQLPSPKHQTTAETNRLSASEAIGVGDHLDHLLPPPSLRTPLYRALLDAAKELMHPTVLPPLEVTSMPIEVGTMRGLYAGNEWKAGAFSIGINATIIALLLLVGTNPTIQEAIREKMPVFVAPVLRKPPVVPLKTQAMSGGGGGGAKTPDTQGALPKVAPRTFVPPTVNTVETPKLPMAATIANAPDIQINATNFGDPSARVGVPSNGTGDHGGIGPGDGPGIGPGKNGGYGGDVYRPGIGGVSAPIAITKPEPEYSEEGRKAKQQGEVLIQFVVDETGHARNLRVLKGLGLGLDEKAKDAVARWLFKPGLKDGKPVPVIATVAVTFRLL
ncbi:MAG: energy transducer TonB, partial [Acidobacteriota bacterium]